MRAWSHGRTRILLLLVRHMVLIIDDDEEVREAVRDLVGMKGYRVEEARDGEQALALLERAEVPCIILLDLVMPVMDGWQFLERLRASARLASVPVVVVSAHAASHAPVGASGLLLKPFEARELLRAIADKCGPPG
jgi:CheY-like chemotaxis protein